MGEDFPDLFDTELFSVSNQRQPIVFQEGDNLRLWFSPTRKSEDTHLLSSYSADELAIIVESIQIFGHLPCPSLSSSVVRTGPVVSNLPVQFLSNTNPGTPIPTPLGILSLLQGNTCSTTPLNRGRRPLASLQTRFSRYEEPWLGWLNRLQVCFPLASGSPMLTYTGYFASIDAPCSFGVNLREPSGPTGLFWTVPPTLAVSPPARPTLNSRTTFDPPDCTI